MKCCFMFISREDAKKVEQHLSNQFMVEKDSYLGYDTLYVPKNDYRQAVVEGLKFINFSDIRTAWWIDADNQRMPTGVVPLLFAELPPMFKNNKFLKKAAEMLCCQYAHSYENLLGIPVLWKETPTGNIEFYLVRCHEVIDNHASYMKSIIEYCKSHRHIFSYITVCDAYGEISTTINKDCSVA